MKVVVLIGPSSAGKSTLCKKMVHDHGWLTHGDDKVMEMIENQRMAILKERFNQLGLLKKLATYMSEQSIIKLAATGKFEMDNGKFTINHQFETPEFPQLENVLSKAGFRDAELTSLIKLLEQVGKEFRNLPMPNPLEKMLDDVVKLPPDSSVVLDIVPHPHDAVEKMLNDYNEILVDKAKKAGISVDFATVIAYCPPKALSARIKQRNEQASQTGQLNNKREGTFPFMQLSQLTNANETSSELDNSYTLSQKQLLNIVSEHQRPASGGKDELGNKKALTERVGKEYGELQQRFGLNKADNVSLAPRTDLGAHAVIDLSKVCSPSEFADELIAKTSDAPPLTRSIEISPPPLEEKMSHTKILHTLLVAQPSVTPVREETVELVASVKSDLTLVESEKKDSHDNEDESNHQRFSLAGPF